ncbi:TraR/DksA family transcriptional regulator [Enterobacter sp. E105B]|uniref:TraR/DksA family transcriptional regulator n=1 Tax=Enterobacter sp. E105B TaxID=3047465 RepID=UPI0025A0A50E|nr:TraR/DksA family transcriptional regulator [Enterobacter sp. E105B]
MSAELIDAANEQVVHNLQIALANRRTFSNAVSATHCTDCGDDIPELRRVMVPGCQRCASCQEDSENIKHLRAMRVA